MQHMGYQLDIVLLMVYYFFVLCKFLLILIIILVVGWEAYKHKKRDYLTEAGKPMSMTQVIVERSVFQAIASIAVPFLVIHTTVDVATKVFKKYLPKYTKFGPSIVGLSIIPLLPLYLDHPVEHALEGLFKKYGPWAEKEKKE